MIRKLGSIISERFIFIPVIPVGKYEVIEEAEYRGRANVYEPNALDRLPPWLVCDWSPDEYSHPINHREFPLKDKPTLHRDFSLLNGAGQIVDFATKHGFLGYPLTLRKRSDNGDKLVIGESLRRWKFEVRQIRDLLTAWDKVGLDIDGHSCSDTVYNENRANVCTKINLRIRKNVYPQILPRYDDNMYLWVENLIASFYVMFAWEVRSEIRLYCPGCGIFFKPNVRRDAKTCSDKCRQKVSRINRRSGIRKGKHN